MTLALEWDEKHQINQFLVYVQNLGKNCQIGRQNSRPTFKTKSENFLNFLSLMKQKIYFLSNIINIIAYALQGFYFDKHM